MPRVPGTDRVLAAWAVGQRRGCFLLPYGLFVAGVNSEGGELAR